MKNCLNRFVPEGFASFNGSNDYNVYIVKGNDCSEAQSANKVLCVKINDVFMIKSDS